jgi:hypothetical protein
MSLIPSFTGYTAVQSDNDALINPFASLRVSDKEPGATDTAIVTINYPTSPTDSLGSLSGPGLTKIEAGTYSIAATSLPSLNSDLRKITFTPIASSISTTAQVEVIVADTEDGISAGLDLDVITPAATSLTWIGGGNNKASNPKDWSPDQKPVSGETLTMAVSGTMNIKGADLAGDTLTIGGSEPTDTLNLNNATIGNIGLNGFESTNITMNLTGANNVNFMLDSNIDAHGSLDIIMRDNATLTGDFSLDRWNFDTIDINGGTFINNNQDAMLSGGSTETLNCKIEGTGSFTDVSTLTFMKPVSAGQTVNFQGEYLQGDSGVLNLADALAFKGSIVVTGETGPNPQNIFDVADATINLAGLAQSTSYSFVNDILTLFDANKIVDTLKLTTPYAVSVDKTATGITVYSGYNPQTNPQGTALPLHT